MSNIVKISELTDEEKEKWKKHVQETLPTARNVKDSSAVELQTSDTPIISKADPRLRMARKRLTEYTAEDYNTASKLASINQRKYSNIINNMADKNPVGAFLLNAEMNLANGMNQSVMGINNAINTIGASATKGIENIAKFTNNTDLENRARDTYNKRIAEGNYLDIASKFISGGNQGINNGVIRTGGNVASTIGNQLMSAGLGGSTGLSGSTTQAIGVAGSSAQEVLNENKDNIVQALITGGTKGYLSKKIEDVFDANILTSGSKKTSIQKQVNNWIANSFKSNTGKLIAQNVSGVLGENAEEFLEDNLGNIIDKFVNNKDLPSFEEWWNNTTETAKATTLTTIVMQLLGFGGGDIDTEVDSDVDFWTKEAQKIVNDKSIQNNTQNIQQNQVNNQRNLPEQQITQIENNVAQNQNMEQIDTENVKPQLDNILNNKELPMQSYIYEKSSNEKINTIREDASKYFNNSEKAHNYMKMLEKIIEDKDINIRLDANLKTVDGRVANGSYSNGSITINPNSTRTGEFIAVHELTHAIGTKEMLDMVENYRKSNIEFDNSVKKLLNNYNSTEITEEALSDVSAQLFGTQEFINNVAQNNPNIFQKLYSEIKYLWHQFRGYKNQDQFIDDLYYKWTQAYNNSDKLNKSSSFSIQTNSDGSKYVQVDTDQNIFEGIDKKDYNKIAKMYMQDYLMGKTQLSDNDNAIIDRKSANKYTNPGKKQQNFDKKMQLTPELKNVLEIAQIDSVSAPTKDTSKYRNWEYYKFKFELSGKKFEGTVNIGIDSDGNKHFYEINKIKEVDDISGKNLNRSSASSINNSIASGNKDVNTTAKYSMQESENNSGSFNFDKNVKRYEDLQDANAIKFNKKIDGTINVEITNDNELINQISVVSKENALKQLGSDIASYIYDNATEDSKTIRLKQTKNLEVHDTSHKGKQLEIIKKTNPMLDDYHVGIRNVEDIKAFNEVVNDEDSFAWGDFTREDAKKALKEGKITVYSSYPINQGTFVSTSKIQAEEYAGGKKSKVYSKTIPLNEVAWVNGDEGQYAKVKDEKFSVTNNTWQSYLEDNYKSDGTKTNLQDIKLPTAPKQVAPSMANNKLSKASDTKNEDIPDTREYLTEKRTKDKVSFSEIKDTLAQRLVNKGHYIDKLAEKTGNNELKYKYDRTMNSFNEAQISIGEHQVDSNGKVVGKSLLEIFQPAKDMNLKTEFEDYLANKHNISRDAVGKNIYGGEVTAPQSSEIVKKYEESHPEFKQWSEEVSKYNDNNLRDLVNSGMVSENLYNNLKEMYGDYVPIYRDIVSNMQEYSDDKVGGNTLKRATKSGKEILSIEESMAEQTLSIKKAIRINEVGVELAKTLGKDSVILDNINFDPIAIETLGGDVISKAEDGTNIFTIFQNGEMSHFKISNEIYSAFSKSTSENYINNHKVVKTLLTPVEKLSKAQRNLLTTYSVGFALNNPIKDIQDAVFNTKYSTATFSKNYLKALYNLGTNGEWAQSYMNNGGNANTYFDYSKGLLPTKQNVVKKVANKILQVNEVLEQAPRLAEYISTIENGGTINEALYNAADITTNFKRGGDITKAVNKYGVNFLNASVQGLDKVYRNITGKNGVKGYANLLVKATMFQIAPAILNGLILGDDDDYDKLPEYTKDNYFLIKMSDGRFFRIPKGRVSSVVGGIARRALEKVQGKEVDWSSIVDTTVNQLAPNNPLTDNIVAPIIQAKNNKTWYGGDLVSSRLKKLPEAEQYDESTDSLSKFIGEKLNISPKKLNYVIDQYSGGIGDVILPMMTPQAENNIIEDKFTTDSVMKNKNVSKYYSTLEELEKKKNSVNVTDEDKLKYKYMYDATEDLSSLYKQKREIQKSDINDNEKKTKVREIQKQINNIVEEKLNGLNSLSANGTTGKVGDSEYYQSEGKWTSLSEKDEEKNANISLETYANYKNTVKQLTNEKRQNGELKDTEQLKDKDKIQILLNSKYSDKEKSAIYEEYILNPNNSTYNVMKSAGINIDEWLKYSKQEFTSDKKDDGTVNGSTVSGSKKKKVYAYIENMNITYSQKLLLKGMQYSLTDSEKSKVDNYVRKLNISNSEKLDILGKIKGFTIYKDNTYEY